MIKPIDRLNAMAPYALATLDESLVSLAQNESFCAPSPEAIKAGSEALANSAYYPDPDWTTLRQVIADTHDVNAAGILCAAGSMELISATIRAYVDSGEEVLGCEYGYLFVATVCAQIGARYIQAPESDYCVDVDAILERVSPVTRVVFVCNPGNPTGTRIPNSELLRLRRQLPENVLLVIDQAYGEFDNQDHAQVFALLQHQNTVVTRTFSKAYCLAGQRLGWGAFPEKIASEVRKLLNPNNVSVVTQAMGIAAMLDQNYLQEVVQKTADIRVTFQKALSARSLATPTSFTNFVLVPFKDAQTALGADTALKQAGFVARGMGGYNLSHCLRVTIGTSDVMQTVADALLQVNEGL